jgi:hypothetical protein
LVVCPEVAPGKLDQLTITRMVDRFDGCDSQRQIRTVLSDVLAQFRLCVGRAGDQDHASIGYRLGHSLEKVVIFGGMPTADAVGFVMQVLGWMLRMDDKLVGVRCIKMEDTRFVMIDPNHGMMVY